MKKKFWKNSFHASAIALVLWLSMGILVYAQDLIDLTALPMGDGLVSTEPQIGYIWSCQSQFNGGGAFQAGPWIQGDTWDMTTKITVDGAVLWENALFTIEVLGDERIFESNGLPEHPTGIYPVQASDDAYQYDRNPNSIQEQSLSFALPLNPILADSSSCVGGEVGIALTGIPIFNGFDAAGRDAGAHEIQDDCAGHPEVTGQYHYHSLSPCIEDEGEGHSALVGYAFDGFGIFGYRGEDGEMLSNANLDECHGHSHEIEWDGATISMYHYHATAEFPYTVACYRGTPAQVRLGNGQSPQGSGQPPQGGGQPPQGGGQPPQGGGQPPQGGGQPPQSPPPTPQGGGQGNGG